MRLDMLERGISHDRTKFRGCYREILYDPYPLGEHIRGYQILKAPAHLHRQSPRVRLT